MFGLLLDTVPTVTQPSTAICNSPPLLTNPITVSACDLNQDTLISSAFAIAVTLVIVFVVASRLRPGVPGKMQMVLELFLDYVKGLVHYFVGEGSDFIIPIAATIGLYILVANWIAFLPLAHPLQPAAADLNQTLAMAVVVVLVVQVYSFKVLGFRGTSADSPSPSSSTGHSESCSSRSTSSRRSSSRSPSRCDCSATSSRAW